MWFARLMCCMSGSSSTALCARNAHITLYDVTTWSWVNLVNPELDKASVHLTMMQVLSLTALLLVFPLITSAQFRAVCNTPENLQNKTCCPNDCGSSSGRGNCTDITTPVAEQWIQANSDVVSIMLDAPNQPQKRTADSRYQWPTVVFERVCKCSGNYGGVDCGDCDFGWTGGDCATRKTPVFRKSFDRLSEEEKQTFVDATVDLKNEMGIWECGCGRTF